MKLTTALLSFAAAASAYRVGIYGSSENVQLIYQYPNGTHSNVSSPIYYEGQAQQLSAIDSKAGIYYLVGYNFTTTKPNLVGIDISTGNIVSDVPLPFAESAFVGVGQQLAVANGRVVVGGVLVANGPHTVGWIDPKTGSFDQVAALPANYLPVLGGASIYDPAVNSLVMPLGTNDTITLFSVNMGNGAVTPWPEDYPSGHNLDTLDYDPVTGLIYGLGIAPINATNYERTLVALDSKALKWTIVGKVADYLIESGGVAALDYQSRLLYWIGQKTGAGESDPFYLIGLSLKDASVASAAVLCSDDAECPWSLEYASPK